MRQQIGDHLRRDAQLTIGKVLDENGAEERVVGQPDPDGQDCTQPRTEIGKRDGPGPRRLASGDQKAAPALHAGIVEVEQRMLGGAIGIVDRDPMPALRDETRHHLLGRAFRPAQ